MSDLSDAAQLEQFGDTAESRDAATGFYRKAQLLLMPPGGLWSPGEEYDHRMEAFGRIQQKLYALSNREFPNSANPPARWPEAPPAEAIDLAAHTTEVSGSDSDRD